MTDKTENSEIITDIVGTLGIITLNRPKALNSLTHGMIKIILACLDEWEHDERIRAVLFRGAGERAFCAGGDVKYIYQSKKAYDAGEIESFDPADYFYDEYNMNRRLLHSPKPLIAFMDGVTMGGGYGVAGPCDFRIATKSTVFAMPEVGIGFFPDIGGVYHLHQCRKNMASYLCLTGNSLDYADTLRAGVATHIAASGDEEALIAKLAMTAGDAGEIDAMIRAFQPEEMDAPSLAEHEAVIDRCFSQSEVIDILTCLERRNTQWALKTVEIIKLRSPLSVAVTMRHLNEARDADFDTVIAKDFTICQHFMNGHDFFEGVRATVIDKDKNPKWQHKALSDVTTNEIDAYFSPAKRKLY